MLLVMFFRLIVCMMSLGVLVLVLMYGVLVFEEY